MTALTKILTSSFWSLLLAFLWMPLIGTLCPSTKNQVLSGLFDYSLLLPLYSTPTFSCLSEGVTGYSSFCICFCLASMYFLQRVQFPIHLQQSSSNLSLKTGWWFIQSADCVTGSSMLIYQRVQDALIAKLGFLHLSQAHSSISSLGGGSHRHRP